MIEVLLNDASLEGQFNSSAQFSASFQEILKMQNLLKESGLRLSICIGLTDKMITPTLTFQQWVNNLSQEKRSLVYLWIANGPWWDSPKAHPDDYFTWDGDRANALVTTTALAEAACLHSFGHKVWLATIAPSRFALDPAVIWWETPEPGNNIRCEIRNFWSANYFEAALAEIWHEAKSLENICIIIEKLQGRKVNLKAEAMTDLGVWIETSTPTVNRIIRLLKSIVFTPFTGIGKPEPLKHDYAGAWSRRIDGANRIIYIVQDDSIEVLRARGHYN